MLRFSGHEAYASSCPSSGSAFSRKKAIARRSALPPGLRFRSISSASSRRVRASRSDAGAARISAARLRTSCAPSAPPRCQSVESSSRDMESSSASSGPDCRSCRTNAAAAGAHGCAVRTGRGRDRGGGLRGKLTEVPFFFAGKEPPGGVQQQRAGIDRALVGVDAAGGGEHRLLRPDSRLLKRGG